MSYAANLRHAGRGVDSQVHLLLQLEQRDIIQLGVGVEVLMDDDCGNVDPLLGDGSLSGGVHVMISQRDLETIAGNIGPREKISQRRPLLGPSPN